MSSIDNIHLSNLAVGELYGNSLLTSPGKLQPLRQPAQPSDTAVTASSPGIPPASSPGTADIPPAPPPEPSLAAPSDLKFLGNHRRRITILVHSPGSAFLPDDQLSFLTKMLEACRMNIGDVAIINNAAAPVTITALRQQLQPATILLFGLEPTAIRLPINFPAFRLQPYDDCTYLSAPSLQLLVQPSEESKLLKSKLWLCLKTLFNV
jgi:hypothetical protein